MVNGMNGSGKGWGPKVVEASGSWGENIGPSKWLSCKKQLLNRIGPSQASKGWLIADDRLAEHCQPTTIQLAFMAFQPMLVIAIHTK
jgi:hypothetical protein